MTAILGDRATVDRFLSSPKGARFARAAAAAIFADDDQLAAFELGENLSLPAAVEYQLDKLIAQRNREEDA